MHQRIKASREIVNKEGPVKLCVQTDSGKVLYTEQGTGPVALIVFEAFSNSSAWREQLSTLHDIRRVVTVELLTFFETSRPSDGDLAKANARMLGEFMSCLKIDQADLVGFEVASGVVQVFAATHPERVRSVAFSEYCAPNDYAPLAQNPFIGLVAKGHLRELTGREPVSELQRQALDALGPATVQVEVSMDPKIERYGDSFAGSVLERRHRQHFITSLSNEQTIAAVSLLKELEVPALLVWGEDETLFGAEWNHASSQTVPGTVQQLEFQSAQIFPLDLNLEDCSGQLRLFWRKVDLRLH
jgi:pimeloyl-ACP methyl ester carboxylesterase